MMASSVRRRIALPCHRHAPASVFLHPQLHGGVRSRSEFEQDPNKHLAAVPSLDPEEGVGLDPSSSGRISLRSQSRGSARYIERVSDLVRRCGVVKVGPFELAAARLPSRRSRSLPRTSRHSAPHPRVGISGEPDDG